MSTLAEIQARDIRDSHHEKDGTLAFKEALRDRTDLLSMLKAETERADMAVMESAVLLERATALTREAVYRRGDKEYTVTDKTFSPLYSAVMNFATIAAAHLALHRRLVEGQRTNGAVQCCTHCGSRWDGPATGCDIYPHCPIRAGVKP